MIESRSMNQCGRRDLNPHTHWVSDFKSEASADSATAARTAIIAHLTVQHKPGIGNTAQYGRYFLNYAVFPYIVAAPYPLLPINGKSTISLRRLSTASRSRCHRSSPMPSGGAS